MNKLKQSILSIVIGLALAAGVSLAWTGPTANPTGDNTPAPINVGGDEQFKTGALGIGGMFKAYSDAIFNGNVGIGIRDWVTNPPTEKLEVVGGIRVGDTTNTNAGTIRWTGSDFEGYVGSGGWKSLTGGSNGSGCTLGTQPVLIGSVQICLKDGAYAGVAKCSDSWAYAHGSGSAEVQAEARFQSGKIQTRVKKTQVINAGVPCDTGWVDGYVASCGNDYNSVATSYGVHAEFTAPVGMHCEAQKLWQ